MPILHPEFRLLGSTRNHVIAKLLLMTLIGIAAGAAITYSNRSDVAQGNAMTLEQYTAGFEAYKASLIAKQTSMPLFIVVCVVMTIAFFIPYELIGALLSHLLDRIAPPASRPQADEDTA